MWKWIWPCVHSNPTTEGLDTEMFDRTDYPYTDTFVREAIQNSLDARLDKQKPVTISFRFHQEPLGERKPFLEGAIAQRKKARLRVPAEWDEGKISWITIEDYNAKGLSGDLEKRSSDFWNYWLNFGVSNKDGSERGGRGIGRVTFLIASQVQTVIGLTRRSKDAKTAACGMCVLKSGEFDGEYKSTHTYLASEEDNSRYIYKLHESEIFHRELKEAFEFTGYEDSGTSGLALAIPYPYSELNPRGILASAIEHFAPAIMNGTLQVCVDGISLNASSLEEIANDVALNIHSMAIRENVERYLQLIKEGLTGELVEISVSDLRNGLQSLKDTAQIKELQKKIDSDELVGLCVAFPLEWKREVHTVRLKTILARTPSGFACIDRLFREGMSLPDVTAKIAPGLDMITLVDDELLATYLNCCEGKAHLDLLESQMIREKLDGYHANISVRRFIKRLPSDLRDLFIPDIIEPDANIFDAFFSIPKANNGNKPKKEKDRQDPPPPPPPKVPAFIVEPLPDGFRYKANPDYEGWPVNALVRAAYADGSRKPDWSEFDFRISELGTKHEGCSMVINDNEFRMSDCTRDCSLEVTGFDTKRELDTRLKVWKNAQAD